MERDFIGFYGLEKEILVFILMEMFLVQKDALVLLIAIPNPYSTNLNNLMVHHLPYKSNRKISILSLPNPHLVTQERNFNTMEIEFLNYVPK